MRASHGLYTMGCVCEVLYSSVPLTRMTSRVSIQLCNIQDFLLVA